MKINIKKWMWASAFLMLSGYMQAQTTQVIAHRGFWRTEGSSQNSLTALAKADSIGCYWF